MNQIATTERNPMNSVAIATGANGSSIAPQSLGDVVRFAEVMCRADIALPKHLRGNAGACMAVALQALEWQMSPFAVASKSYAVNGAIAYEAQLIAAVVNTRSGIKGRLRYEFIGEGNDLSCKVTGVLDGDECEYETPPIGSITTKNSPLWKSDPRQQLGYFAARSWARRHCPEVILGVYDRDEASTFQGPDNAKDITPSLAQRLAAAKTGPEESPQTREGFDPDFVTRETAALTGEADGGQTEDNSSSADSSPADGSDGEASSSTSTVAATDTASQGDVEEGASTSETVKPADGQTAAPSSEPITQSLMKEALDKFMALATDQTVPDPKQRRANIEFAKNAWKEALPQRLDFVKACFETADKIVKGELLADPARRYLEGLL